MKEHIQQLNKIFENRYRLGIMSLLMIHERIEFLELKQTLDLTDGNLASHANTLEQAGYIQILKEAGPGRQVTLYSATAEGRKAFTDHLENLEKILKNIQ